MTHTFTFMPSGRLCIFFGDGANITKKVLSVEDTERLRHILNERARETTSSPTALQGENSSIPSIPSTTITASNMAVTTPVDSNTPKTKRESIIGDNDGPWELNERGVETDISEFDRIDNRVPLKRDLSKPDQPWFCILDSTMSAEQIRSVLIMLAQRAGIDPAHILFMAEDDSHLTEASRAADLDMIKQLERENGRVQTELAVVRKERAELREQINQLKTENIQWRESNSQLNDLLRGVAKMADGIMSVTRQPIKPIHIAQRTDRILAEYHDKQMDTAGDSTVGKIQY